MLCIPAQESVRATLFGDPVPMQLKSIFVTWPDPDTLTEITHEFSAKEKVWIHLKDARMSKGLVVSSYVNKLYTIHRNLKFEGTLRDELPEQLIAVQYLTGKETILEIGGNIGRNSCVIASLLMSKGSALKDHLVVLESDPKSYKLLCENRDRNAFDFQVLNAALSKQKLIQKDWNTMP
jgi:hypothetical protein